MILADTSIWIQHLRHGDAKLAERLINGLIVTHPFVKGELACGGLKNGEVFLAELNSLSSLAPLPDSDVLHLVGRAKLWGRGLGWVDVHLLAAALLSHNRLWTLDKGLAEAARDLGVGLPA